MGRINDFAISRPITSTFIILVIVILLLVITYPASRISAEFGNSLAKGLIVLVLLVVIVRSGWIQMTLITKIGNKQGWLMTFFLLIILLPLELYLFTGKIIIQIPEIQAMASLAIGTMMGSLMEEIIFRGIILSLMLKAWQKKKRGLYIAIIGSSIAFGIFHFINLGIRSFDLVAMQVVGTMLAGIVYGALVILSESIWPAVIIHWLTNLVVNIEISFRLNYQETISMWLLLSVALVPLIIFLFIRLNDSMKRI